MKQAMRLAGTRLTASPYARFPRSSMALPAPDAGRQPDLEPRVEDQVRRQGHHDGDGDSDGPSVAGQSPEEESQEGDGGEEETHAFEHGNVDREGRHRGHKHPGA